MKNIFTILFLAIATVVMGQVPKKVIVEHFTNTRCSVCASRNPGFFNNFNSQNTGDMLHVAIHPSSPYNNCFLNNHNATENDARTQYYGIYGSTPRLVINGEVIPASQSYNNPSLFTPYKGLTSPIDIQLTQQKFGADSIRVRVVLKVVSTHSLPSQNLFVSLIEDTIAYAAPNGEGTHYDVFRRSLNGSPGSSVTLPTNVGDSLVYTYTVLNHPDWNEDRIYSIAILQNAGDKEVTQSASLKASDNDTVMGVGSIGSNKLFSVFPTLATSIVNVKTKPGLRSQLWVISISGELVYTSEFNGLHIINVSTLPRGLYFIRVENSQGKAFHKIIKN